MTARTGPSPPDGPRHRGAGAVGRRRPAAPVSGAPPGPPDPPDGAPRPETRSPRHRHVHRDTIRTRASGASGNSECADPPGSWSDGPGGTAHDYGQGDER
ncbi:hypothetical protein GCM10019016_018590 [Streptomyces prasinosporus]|uniref:Uncharacterized protein n=1 Tax=Streptomyces prasinosporus TaxID=68256 RepID=A0ABP6THP5_9ACTN